jgi:peptidoglycan L-alanyl-D-glutamate endopeptidase CwlK
MSQLLQRDLKRLEGVHPDLVRVVERARDKISFFVVEGLRSIETQRANVARGASQTMNSRHLTGHAVDLCPWLDRNGNNVVDQDEVNWSDIASFRVVADKMKEAAAEEGVPIEWGGDWKSFYDGPHFQLPRSTYP